MLTFGTEIVIRYIASECVRLRPIPPPAGPYYISDRTKHRGMHVSFNEKIVGVYYILCVLWYAYYGDSKSVDISTFLLL